MNETGNKMDLIHLKVCLTYVEVLMYVDKKYLKVYYLFENYFHQNYGFCLDEFSHKFWRTFDDYNMVDKLYVYMRGDKIEEIVLPDTMFFMYYKKACFVIYNGMFSLLFLFIIYTLLNIIIIRHIKSSYYFFKVKNEVENNLSNYCDISRLIVLFFFFFNFSLSFYITKYFLYTNITMFVLFLSLNIIEIVSYLYIFNINLFIFIKGTLDEINLLFVELFDSISLLTFISRLLLQFLRLVICIVVFFNMHMLGNELLTIINNYYISDADIEPNGFISFFFKTILEYLDMLLNFCTQYSIYIIVVMWLLPFLFSFVKTFLKIKNV